MFLRVSHGCVRKCQKTVIIAPAVFIVVAVLGVTGVARKRHSGPQESHISR